VRVYQFRHIRADAHCSPASFRPCEIGNGRCVSPLLLIILIILLIAAFGGGLFVNNLLWLLLVIALIVLVFGLFSGRTTV
jgi:hypothetical protein